MGRSASFVFALVALLGGAARAARPSAWDRPAPRPIAQRALRGVLRDVRSAARRGERPVVGVDIDDTAMNARPRLRAAAKAAGLPTTKLVSQADLYWGLEGAEREAKRAQFGARYFDDPTLTHLDRPQRGAVRFLREVRKAGGRVLYVSGRWESTRATTEAMLKEKKLPLARSADLILNPSEQVKASDYKRALPARLRRMGKMVAMLDNEAEAVNDYHRAFPKAAHFRLGTFRFREAPERKPRGVLVIRDFALGR